MTCFTVTAFKYCEPNGAWFRHPESQKVWSNYTTCINIDDLSVSNFNNNKNYNISKT